MASFLQFEQGWRAQVAILGVRKSRSFRTKREAAAWASALETQIREDAGKTPGERHTLSDALTRYRDEVSPSKRGGRWEVIRIEAFLRSSLPINKQLASISPEDIAIWRDERLRVVGNGTVLRDIGLLSAVLEHSRREWRWIQANPVSDVRKPRQPDHRERIITRAEIKAMLRQFGYVPGRSPRSITESIGIAFVVALRTGMRQSELCTLTWNNVFDEYCVLPVTKTKPRHVSLSEKARRTIETMRGFDSVLVFGVSSQTLEALFRRTKKRAGLSGFTFHDSRHTAATWIAQKLQVLDLCKMFGWTSTNQAMVYYNPSAKDIAKRL